LRLIRQHLHSAASAAVAAGVAVEQLASLAILVQPDTFRIVLRQLWQQDGRKLSAYTHGIAITLIAIAAEWVQLPAETIATFKTLRKQLGMLPSGLTEKNEAVLRAFDDPYLLKALMDLPDRLWRDARRSNGPYAFVALQTALAIDILTHVPVRMPVITSVQLLELGLKLMDENKPQPDASLDVHRAVAYRDGLMIAVLAYLPIRPKNLASLEIGRHIVLENGRWFILVPREETKSGKRIQFELPEALIPYLNLYLESVRPGILAGKKLRALWVSPKRGPLSYVGIIKSFGRLSERLGVKISPHDARDAAVTTWAIARPDQIGIARDLLYHSNPDTSTRHYNRARGIEASRTYRRIIHAIRHQPRHQPNKRSC
jgi:integrase